MRLDRDQIVSRIRDLRGYIKRGQTIDLELTGRLLENIENLIVDLEARNHELRGMYDHITGKYLKMTDKNREEQRAEGKGP